MDIQPSPTTPFLSPQPVPPPFQQLPHLSISPMSSSTGYGNVCSDDRPSNTDWATFHARTDTGGTNFAKGTLTIPVSVLGHLANLSTHIAKQGFFHGVGSDITVRAFDKEYRLHRLILMQAKFFESMMQGPWREQHTSAVLMQFDDANITREGFEVAVGRLYGIWTVEDEGFYLNQHAHDVFNDNKMNLQFSVGSHNIRSAHLTKRNVLAVLAAAAYLGIDALCDQCSKFAIRTLSTDRVVEYVQFSDLNCYNPWSSRIADACHSFLCRNGFEDSRMDCLQVFERLPKEWLIRVIGSDAFWVPSEWDRYIFCRRVVHQRRKIWRAQFQQLKHHLDDSNEVEGPSPCTPSTSTYTFEQQDGQKTGAGSKSDLSSGVSPSTKCLPPVTDEAVHDRLFSCCVIYDHMSFEQLQAIMNDIDPLTGHRFTPTDIIHEALWQQTELRTIIETSHTTDHLLGNTASHWPQMSDRPNSRRRSHDLIPVRDGTHDGDLFIPPWNPQSFEQTDDRLTRPYGTLSIFQKNEQSTSSAQYSLYTNAGVPLPVQSRSRFAPFRFSVAFQDIKLLEANVRISSKEFYYAGSLWNVYIQKINNGQSGLQLGVHLHRHSKSSVPSPKTRMAATLPSSDAPAQPSQEGSDNGGCGSGQDLPSLDRNLSETGALEQSFSNYVDKREKTKTWFKIFATSGGPDHLIRQFQSSPDDFAVLQSWGWRSTSLWQSILLQGPKGSATEREERLQTTCVGLGHTTLPDHKRSAMRKGKQIAGEEVIRPRCNRAIPGASFRASPWEAIKRRLSDLGEEQTVQAKTRLSGDHQGCDCEASLEIELGRQHHHHLNLPPALKFSIVMGHV